jgi:hypothetical protein
LKCPTPLLADRRGNLVSATVLLLIAGGAGDAVGPTGLMALWCGAEAVLTYAKRLEMAAVGRRPALHPSIPGVSNADAI